MAYISKIKLQDTLYEIIADKNTEKKTLATQEYTDAAAAAVKNELLNGAGEAYDTLKELGDLIDENNTAIEALEQVATNKQDKLTGNVGQFVVFNNEGVAAAADVELGSNTVLRAWTAADLT